jgi:hypothetical protein
MNRLKGALKQALGDEGGKKREPLLREYEDKSLEFERVYQMRKDYIVPVNQTLILVSQVQRSGGSLMSQLFDGHPEIHAHPAELYIGYPEKQDFPNLDLSASPETWFELLYEEPSLKNFRNGYKKFPDSAQYDKPDIFPFLLLPNLQRELFLHAVKGATIKTQRDIIDCYMTSYFNAWLDYQGLYQPKKFITAFVPRLSMVSDSMERYFRDYPEGRLISVIREPKGWYGSSHRQRPHVYPTAESSIPFWMESARAMIANKTRYGDKVFLLAFDALLKDTEGTMRKLAAWMGLTWDAILTEPTFQRMPIKANTAFSANTYGVIDAPLKREKDVDPADAAYIDSQAADLYQQVLGLVD